jgi:hypothetical protein
VRNVNVGAAGLPPTGGDNNSAVPGGNVILFLLLPLGAVIATAGVITMRRTRRSRIRF